jgi:hypothetical protein
VNFLQASFYILPKTGFSREIATKNAIVSPLECETSTQGALEQGDGILIAEFKDADRAFISSGRNHRTVFGKIPCSVDLGLMTESMNGLHLRSLQVFGVLTDISKSWKSHLSDV